MGANTFMNTGDGKTAKEAFSALVEQSRHEDGHSYSGCIGMKSSFVMITVPDGITPRDHADRLLDEDDRRIVDTDGPAGCVSVGEGRWLFFGWARS